MSDGSALAGVRYARRAHDLARFVDDPADAVVRAYVADAVDRPDRAEARARLGIDDAYTLLAFAKREAARAYRQSDLGCARTAVAALTLVDRDTIDYRDLSVDFPLLAVREHGGDVDQEIDSAVVHSASGTARSFEGARARARTIELADCALVRVATSYGIGFMEDWTGSRRPPVELAELAVVFSDAIDGEGTYRTASFRVSDLPAVWFGQPGVRDVPTRGCVSFTGDHVTSAHPFSHSLLVFLAELEDEAETRRLADKAAAAATLDRPRAAATADLLLAVFVGGSGTAGEAPLESMETLRRFGDLIPSLGS